MLGASTDLQVPKLSNASSPGGAHALFFVHADAQGHGHRERHQGPTAAHWHAYALVYG